MRQQVHARLYAAPQATCQAGAASHSANVPPATQAQSSAATTAAFAVAHARPCACPLVEVTAAAATEAAAASPWVTIDHGEWPASRCGGSAGVGAGASGIRTAACMQI